MSCMVDINDHPVDLTTTVLVDASCNTFDKKEEVKASTMNDIDGGANNVVKHSMRDNVL